MGEVTLTLSLENLEALALELVTDKRSREKRRIKLLKALENGSGIPDLLAQAKRKQQGTIGDARFTVDANPKINASKSAMIAKENLQRGGTTRIAIVGCGEIADSYVASLDESWHVVSVYDPDESRAVTLSSRIGACSAPSLEQALKGVEVVLNLTPAEHHASVSRAALEMGCHVWSEKPLASTAEEGRHLCDIAKKNHLKLGCAPMSLWGDSQQSLLTYLPRIGAVHLAEASVHVAGNAEMREGGWRKHPRFSLGSLRDCGVYALHLITGILGPATHVFAQSGVDNLDLWVMTLRCGEANVILTCTQSLPSSSRSLQVYGEKGHIQLTELWDFDSSVVAFLDPEGCLCVPLTHPPTKKHAPHPHVCNWMRGPRMMLSSDVDFGLHACHVLDIVEAAEASAKMGRRIEISSIFEQLPRLPRFVPFRSGASRIALGALALAKLGKPDAFALLDQAWTLGINMFDSAHVYGQAETMLGMWIKARQVPRDALYLVGKAGHPSKGRSRIREARRDVLESCSRLRVSQLDVLLLHRDDPTMSTEEVLGILSALRHENYTIAWGVSNWSLDRIHELASAARSKGERLAMNSPQVSLAIPTEPIYEGTTHLDDATKNASVEHSFTTLGWSALAGGYLLAGGEGAPWASEENEARRKRLQEISEQTGLSTAAWAVRYALTVADHVVVGTSRPERLVELVRGAQDCDPDIAHWLRHGGQQPSRNCAMNK